MKEKMMVVVVVGHQIGEDGVVHQSNQREWYQRLPRPCTVSSDLSRRNTSYEQESLLGFGIFVTPSHLMSLVSVFGKTSYKMLALPTKITV